MDRTGVAGYTDRMMSAGKDHRGQHLSYDEVLAVRMTLRTAARTLGTGNWRVADDLIDTAFDRVVDRVCRGRGRTRPTRLDAWAVAVLKNLVRSGPPRVALERRGHVQVAPIVSAPADLQATSADGGPLRGLPMTAYATLTPAERRAVEATLEAPTGREAATSAGMSRRDLRTRVRRAGAKLRRWRQQFTNGATTN